nr:putative mismatch repair protein [Tetrahymena thermophila]
MIKKLDQSSILNICVNQVIIDLATCVKELVENSLDAGSTKIEVYLKEYGKEGVEVVDNGSGISSQNLEQIAQKGATSKLRQFQDLESLDTFGFRGEALNAISVLSQLTITTKTDSDEMAYRYQFNQDNTIKSKTLVPRERGTTISLTDLFGNIPVRKQEFNKNIISQYNKLVNMITEYAIISVNCQICLINQSSKKGREMILNSGSPMKNMLQKTAQVFSKKISDMLVDLKFDFGEECSVIEGYILNRQTSGSVQDSKSIQKNMSYLFVNTRPVNPFKKMNSIFSDIYKKYNSSARYIYILHLKVKKDAIDFNVSPDKRDIFIKYENEFYTALRDNLTQLFEKLNSIQKVLMPVVISSKIKDTSMDDSEDDSQESSNQQKQKTLSTQQTKQTKLFQKLKQEINIQEEDLSNEDSEANNQKELEILSFKSPSKGKQITQLKDTINNQRIGSSNSKRKQDLFEDVNDEIEDLSNFSSNSKAQSKQKNDNSEYFKSRNQTFNSDYFSIAQQRKKAYEEQLQNTREELQNSKEEYQENYQKKQQTSSKDHNNQNKTDSKQLINEDEEQNQDFSYFNDKLKLYKQSKQQSENNSKYQVKEYSFDMFKKSKQENSSKGQDNQKINNEDEENCDDQCCTQSQNYSNSQNEYKSEDSSLYKMKEEKQTKQLKQSLNQEELVQKHFQIQEEARILNKKQNNELMEIDEKIDQDQGRAFKIKSKKEDEIEELADDLEEQLKTWESEDFKKDKFVELQIIGQFNKAFIIAYWVEKDQIFLIDQHASDEKTNYERLLKENNFQGQKLVKPIELSLTIQEADILENNREIFKKNGFQFQIKYDESNGEPNLYINQLPSSKHIQFNINDFDEIFQNINNEETDIETFRPKKIQRILASKACRSSIMIGTALNKSSMKQILLNLSKLQSPWNCPHGRPTMVKTPPMNHLIQQVQVKKTYDL